MVYSIGGNPAKAEQPTSPGEIVVTLLGTGSPEPSATRFGPATLVQAGGLSLLFDAGPLFVPGVVDEVAILDPSATHRDGPHFLNVLRVLDIPEALGLLAPDVTLTLIGAKDKAFDRTAAIYKLAGAEAKFIRK